MKHYIVIIILVLGIGSLRAQHRVGVSLSPAKSYTSSNNDGNASVKIHVDHSYVPLIGADNKLQMNHLHAGIRLTVLFDISPNDCNCEWY